MAAWPLTLTEVHILWLELQFVNHIVSDAHERVTNDATLLLWIHRAAERPRAPLATRRLVLARLQLRRRAVEQQPGVLHC